MSVSALVLRCRRWVWTISAWLALFVQIGPGLAATGPATPTVSERNQPMRVMLVYDGTPGCAPSCAEWVSAQGTIVPGTSGHFTQVLRGLGKRKLPIFIDSPGGSVLDAMAIGRLIHLLHLDVYVTQTSMDVCDAKQGACPPPRPDGSRPGHPHGIGSDCASACTLILAAGEKRGAAPWVAVGVHQIIEHETKTYGARLFRVMYRVVDGRREEISRRLIGVKPVWVTHFTAAPPRIEYARVAAYLAQMGISGDLIPMMLATPPTAMHWMTSAEREATRLVTDKVDGVFVVSQINNQTSGASSASVRTPDYLVPSLVHSLPERAFLFTTGTGRPSDYSTSIGQVTWSFKKPGSDSVLPDRSVLVADIDLPDSKLKLSFRMEKTGENTTPPTYAMLVSFTPAPGAPIQTVEQMTMPRMRDDDSRSHITLAGKVTLLKPNIFGVALVNEAQAAINEGLVASKPWLDLPIRFDTDKMAVVTFEHAASGQPAVEQAFRVWRSNTSAGATPKS